MFLMSTRNLPPDVGGIQNLMEGLAEALLNHGPVKVFADSFEEFEEYDKKSSLNIERISGFKVFKKYRKANLVNEFIKNNEIRAVFFDHWKSIENLNQETLEKTTSFCLIHSKEINHEPGTFLNKRMIKSLNKTTFVIANSSFTKDLAVKLGVNSENIKIINPGCNYPIEIRKDSRQQAKNLFLDSFPKFITIARLDKRKSHQNILMCIRNLKVKYPKIKYISIGNGDEKNNLEALRKELGLLNEVNFLYKVDEQLKAALLSASDLFIMPSIIHKRSVEGFGISYIEAASYGKLSIGGNSGGEKDAIKDGITGYICDGNNLESISMAIEKCFKNDNLNTLGKNALKFSQQFKWNLVVKKYLELI